MNCYNHHQDPAVATCIDCGKRLCAICSHKYNIPICDSCNQVRIKNEKNNIIKSWIIAIVIAFMLLPIIGMVNPNRFLLILGALYSALAIVYGWKSLNSITPRVFLVLPLRGWLIYFYFKIMLSLIIGFFVAPIKLYQNIKRYKELKETETLIHN